MAGLAVLPLLETPRHRVASYRAADAPMIVAAALGLADRAVTVPSPAALVTTGYGRLLLAKVAVAVVLVVLGARNRARWVPAARGHQVGAEQSAARAGREVALMVIVLALAAALAVAG
ncbi:CopD family protein [Mycolicibacterium sp. CBM1]